MIDGYGGRCFNVTGHKFPKRYEILGSAESIPYNYLLGFLLLAEVWPKKLGYTPGMETLYEPSSQITSYATFLGG